MRRPIAALAAVALLAACGEEETPAPPPDTVGANPTLSAPVEVLFDALGTPHVYAQSDLDAAYAVGYVQARDRLFQMDFFRRVARGRLSELVGPAALDVDRGQRLIFTTQAPSSRGTHRIEDVIADALPPAMRALLQAYADGVNRFLEDLRAGANGARLPVEYALAGLGAADVAPWAVEDTIAFGRLLSWQLSSSLGEELDYAQLATSGLPPALFADLTRFAPAVASFSLPAAVAPAAPGPALRPAVPLAAPGAAAAAETLAAARRLLGPEKAASNNWVVAPARAAGGHALVANDPHLTLSNPAIWELLHVVTPTRDVAGVAFLGTPVIPIGTNGKIAWGQTVAAYDVTDLYLEQFDGQGRVLTPSGPQAPTLVREAIPVRGLASPATYDIQVIPGHGPLVSFDAATGTGLSFRWTGHEPSDELAAFFDLDAARSVDEALAAWSQFEVGAQNFVVADDQGNVAFYPHAYVPLRGTGSCSTPPWQPLPGASGACEWSGRIPDPPACPPAATPLAYLPCAKNPAQGWVATANADMDGSTLETQAWALGAGPPPARYLYATTDLGYRHARISERLTAMAGGYTLADMTSIQADDLSAFAREMMPGMQAWLDCAAVAAELRPACQALVAWGFSTPAGLSGSSPRSAFSPDPGASSAAAALFHAFVPRFARRVLDDELAAHGLSVNSVLGLAGDQAVAKYLTALAQTSAGTPPAFPLLTGETLCDDVGTGAVETCADMAERALEDAVGFLAQASVFGTDDPAGWRWGRLHRLLLESPLSQLGVPILDLGPYANDGGLYTVDVANFGWRDDGSGGFGPRQGFVQRAGPSVRFAAELVGGGTVRWRAVLPGGESGFPGDAHYADQLPAWLANAAGDQPYTRAEVEAQRTARLAFRR